MELVKENVANKCIDSLGRITIPKAIRARVGIGAGEEMEFYKGAVNGKQFICLCAAANPPSYKYQLVKDIFDEYEIEMPPEFVKKVMDEQVKVINQEEK